MFLDGLEDAYQKGRLMGTFAEECADSYKFTREAQDQFSIASTTRSKQANSDGSFAWEIAPVTVAGKKGEVVFDKDEQPFKANLEKIPTLKPAFRKDGTVTPANSSSISDGAAALVMMRASTAAKLGAKPIATLVGHSTFAQEPGLFTTAPVGAIKKLLAKNAWSVDSVDLWEINEAFAVVTMAAMHDLNLPHDKVNVHGGACALGHPIGASGARIMVTLIGALRKYGKKRGVASLCIGGGEGDRRRHRTGVSRRGRIRHDQLCGRWPHRPHHAESPERLNAIVPAMPREIRLAVERANADDGVHVIVLQGAGRAFCSGYDLKDFAEAAIDSPCTQSMPWDPMIDYRTMKGFTDDFFSLWRSYKPTIAKVQGFAVAGGSDIALCCDLVVMAEDAKIGYMPARVWGCPTTAMWVYRLGAEKAKRMLLTGDTIDGRTAKDWGLVIDAVPEAELWRTLC
jgi:hypothetical protein